MDDTRRRYSAFAKLFIFGLQMFAGILMSLCSVVLIAYIDQKLFQEAQEEALLHMASRSLWMLAAGGVLWLFCLCYLTVAAGKRCEDTETHLNRFDRIRTEVPVALMFGSLSAILFLVVKAWHQDYQLMGRMIVAGTFSLLAELCFMGLYLSLVRRVKADTFVSNSFLYVLLHNLRNQLKYPFFQTGYARKKRLLEGIERITSGDLDYKLDVLEFQGADRQLAEGINHMGENLSVLISGRVKDERAKANMITNISHDLKTPLTSIINYIGLIRREDIENRKVNGYVDVLEQKALRLKQLMEDLTDVSRISSGNITLQMEEIDLVELIRQTGGEFNGRLEEKGLNVITKFPHDPVMIRADGRQLWRVIGNLYSNVTKYAMPNTRVYAEVSEEEGGASFSIKNIVENPIQTDVSMLTDRFVRGDESRSTEGSGLGLSISKMLTELMGGTFSLKADEDLFKVTVTLQKPV